MKNKKYVIAAIVSICMIVIIALSISLVIGGKSSTKVKNSQELSSFFEDDEVVESVASELDIDEDDIVSISDLENVKYLFVYGDKVDLKGVELLKNLEYVYLEVKEVENIKSLAKLEDISDLMIHQKYLKDINKYEFIESLESIQIYLNKKDFTEYKYLEKFDSLERVTITGGKVDYSDLVLSDSVSELSLNDVKGENYSKISKFKKLESISISSLKGEFDVSFLSNLKYLESVYIYGNFINLPTSLDIETLSISDYKGDSIDLSGYKELYSLSINDSKLEDISFIGGLNNLEDLNLSSNNIVDITALSNLTNLTSLNISNNSIVDIQPLATLVELYYLNIEDNNITNFEVLDSLKELESIRK